MSLKYSLEVSPLSRLMVRGDDLFEIIGEEKLTHVWVLDYFTKGAPHVTLQPLTSLTEPQQTQMKAYVDKYGHRKMFLVLFPLESQDPACLVLVKTNTWGLPKELKRPEV